jgi:cytochrome b561
MTRALHWLTFALLAAQFTVGYVMDPGGGGRGRGRGRGGESGRGRGRGGDDVEAFGDDALLTLHIALGLTVLALALVRVWWRRRTPLPPWAPALSARDRVLAHWTERALYTSLFAIPLTGLWLVLVSDDALPLHVAAHLVFFAAFAAHVGLVTRRRLLRRML